METKICSVGNPELTLDSNTLDPRPGDSVKLVNLKASSSLNGTIGHLTKEIRAEKRWAVMIGGGKQVKARLCNLVLLRPVDTKSSNVEVCPTYYHNTSLELDNNEEAFDGDQALLDLTKILSKMGLYNHANSAHNDLVLACYLSSVDIEGAVSLFIDSYDSYYDDSNNVSEAGGDDN